MNTDIIANTKPQPDAIRAELVRVGLTEAQITKVMRLISRVGEAVAMACKALTAETEWRADASKGSLVTDKDGGTRKGTPQQCLAQGDLAFYLAGRMIGVAEDWRALR